jgi:hypothetical protein
MDMTPENAYKIEVYAIDWTVVLTKLLKKFDPKSEDDVTVTIDSNGFQTYFIRRDFVPASEIARVIGATEMQVNTAPVIRLRELAAMADWQVPTVDYIGNA